MKSLYLLGSELSALRLMKMVGGSLEPSPGGPLWRLCVSLKSLGLVARYGWRFQILDVGREVLEGSREQPIGASVFLRLADMRAPREG